MTNNILVVSNNPFSNNTSNGRTLSNLFACNNVFSLHQFCISSSGLDDEMCHDFFVMSDKDALKCFLTFNKNRGTIINKKEIFNNNQNAKSSIKKTSFIMNIRNTVWNAVFKKNNELRKWVLETKASIVLLQTGDSPFMNEIAIYFTELLGAKLVVYNSEEYAFKEYDYFNTKSKKPSHEYLRFNRNLLKSIKRIYSLSSLNVFLTDQLLDLYKNKLGINGTVIYNSSSIIPHSNVKSDGTNFYIRYIGNLGNERYKSLAVFSEVLERIKSKKNITFEIYGNFTNSIKEAFSNFTRTKLMGTVSYDIVKELIMNSEINLHVESFSNFYARDVKYGFSTKIPDLIASQNCFLVFAPKEIKLYDYLKKYDCGFWCSNSAELEKLLNQLINGDSLILSKKSNMAIVAQTNHSIVKNSKKFIESMEGILK